MLIPSTGWNSVAIMLFSWCIVTGSAFFLLHRFMKIYDRSKPRLWAGTVVTFFLLIFSQIQWENWLWAFQLAFFLVQVPNNLKTSSAPLVGLILLLLFFWFAYLNIKQQKRTHAAPWIGLGCFVLAFSMVTTYGRGHFGIDVGVTSSRYMSHTILLMAAVLALGYLTVEGVDGRSRWTHFKFVLINVILLGVTICTLLGYFCWLRYGGSREASKIVGKAVASIF
jgi:hypothetical protein